MFWAVNYEGPNRRFVRRDYGSTTSVLNLQCCRQTGKYILLINSLPLLARKLQLRNKQSFLSEVARVKLTSMNVYKRQLVYILP